MRRRFCVLVCLALGLPLNLAVVHGDDKIDFAAQIQPILTAKCAGCHGEEKAAAKLRLDSAEQIGAFGEKDHLLVAGKPDESELYQRLVLPADDKKRMPKGPDPLPEEEIALIKKWIEQGAVLAVAATVTTPAPGEAPMATDEAAKKAAEEAKAADAALKAADEAELAKVAPAAPEALEKLKQAGASVMPLYGESPLLQVSFARGESPAGDEALAALTGVADQVVWLDLSGAQATGAGWGQLAGLKNLNRLHLEKSSVDDASLAHVAALPRLEYLNLYSTGVTDAGLEQLKGAKRLRKLYLWQTKVGYDPAIAMQAAAPGLEINLGWDHPGVVKARLTKELETAKKAVEETTAKAAELQKQVEAANVEKTAAEAKLQELDGQIKALEAPPVAEAAPPAAAEEAAAPAAEAAPTAEAAPPAEQATAEQAAK